MKIKQVQEQSEITRWYKVTGADPVPRPPDGEILPNEVEVSFKDGRWVETIIHGDIRWPDGTVSRGPAAVQFEPGSRHKPPQWARKLARS